MVEDHGNAPEKFRVDRGTVENVIDIDPVTVQLFGEPSDRPSFGLPSKNILDPLSDVHERIPDDVSPVPAGCTHIKKKAWNGFVYRYHGIAKRHLQNKQSTPTPIFDPTRLSREWKNDSMSVMFTLSL